MKQLSALFTAFVFGLIAREICIFFEASDFFRGEITGFVGGATLVLVAVFYDEINAVKNKR